MPRLEGRGAGSQEPLRDPENLLIDGLIVAAWGREKCNCCGRPFDLSGELLDGGGNQVPVAEAWGQDDVQVLYGSRVCDAVRVRAGEDWEYSVGTWSGHACPGCTRKIEQAWIVMPDA